MKKTIRVWAALLALCLLLAMAACTQSEQEDTTSGDDTPGVSEDGGTEQDSSGQNGDEADRTLTIGVTSVNSTHDPLSTTSSTYQTYSLFECLFTIDPETQEVEPYLAERYTWVDDVTLEVKLREDVYFTDGQQLNTEDVLCSFRDVAYVKSGTYYDNYDFDNTEIVDDFTIRFKFFESYAPTLAWMANTPIYCAEDVNAGDAEKWMSSPNGTGPYYCVENVDSAYVTYALKDAEDYWGELPACTQVTYKYYSETSTMYIDFESGNLDVANTISTSDAERVLSGDCPDFTGYYINQYNDVLLIVLPEETAAFDDERVREAFFKSVDAESIATAVYGSLYLPATSILPSSLTKYYEEQETVAYDPEGAQALLEEAGYPDGIDLRLIVTTDLKDVAESLQAYLETGGFHVSVESYDVGTAIPMLRNMESDFVITQSIDGAFAYEPSQAIPITWGPNSTYVPVGMDDEEWAYYFDLALRTEGEERVSAYAALQEWAASEYRFLPICERVSMMVYNTEKLADFQMTVANRPLAQCAVFH